MGHPKNVIYKLSSDFLFIILTFFSNDAFMVAVVFNKNTENNFLVTCS